MAAVNNSLQELLTERDVARLLKLSVGTIRRRRLLHQAPYPVRIGSSVRYTSESITTLIEQCKADGCNKRSRANYRCHIKVLSL